MSRRWVAAAAAVAALVALACEAEPEPGQPVSPTPPSGDLPSSMAALGDSITAGYGSCVVLTSCRRNSWSTGDGFRVDSHYERIRQANPAMRGQAHNFAVPGARAAALADQAASAVDVGAQYVTILVGANDVCRPDVREMTSVTAFRAEIDRTLDVLRAGLPQAEVLVVSIPDLYHLWQIGHGEERVVRAWNRGVCPSMLADPTSTDESDVQRRALVRDRVEAFNTQLAEACRAYGDRCRFDGGAVHRVEFALDTLNQIDYFHPDADGQDILADVTYAASGLAN
ncbi:GDSL-type esterase/lipase family protein [Solwaraspora sp. WMMD406]|uniref:SGNH/GDSL hydrolase family protein n=1 Tax=Solwaraspora sp. WMMD406 TaxID=3016095 RepID=UPI00241760CF|nr:SGNH/GDSL hydrolase family protein [Solwaraspora sp. WMMD406]MDG4766636.1 GDSL-type esterase/lipase family protein [Solwaraspora sp. WMMD406]